MRLFVSVGSTRFDALVSLFGEEAFLRDLEAAGVTQVTVQRGASPLEPAARAGVRVDSIEYAPSTEPYIRAADLVLSHAAAGTRLDVLGCGKPHLLVANETLMHNHQQEYVEALQGSRSCLAFSGIPALRAFVAEPGRLSAEVARMSAALAGRREQSDFGPFLQGELRELERASGRPSALIVGGLAAGLLGCLACAWLRS